MQYSQSCPLFVVVKRFHSHILQPSAFPCCSWHLYILWLLIANSFVFLASSCSCSQPLLCCCISQFRSNPLQSVPATVDSVVVPLRRLHVCYILRRILRPLSTPSFVACSLNMCGQLLSSLPLWHTQLQSASVIASVISPVVAHRPSMARLQSRVCFRHLSRCGSTTFARIPVAIAVSFSPASMACIPPCMSVYRSSWIAFRPIVSHPDSFTRVVLIIVLKCSRPAVAGDRCTPVRSPVPCFFFRSQSRECCPSPGVSSVLNRSSSIALVVENQS